MSIFDDHDGLDGLAAEYVLGTLDLDERQSVEVRRLREPALDAAIRAWEQRLAPLNDALPPVSPEADVFPAIVAAIDRQAAEATVAALRRHVRRWQWTAGLSIAASLLIAVALGVTMMVARQEPAELVAVLAKDAAAPAFVVSVDAQSHKLTVRPVAVSTLPGKSYELWLVNPRYDAPRSLGLIDPASVTRTDRLAAYSADVIGTSALAVSLEPKGGSPTGKPTGPVLFSGKIILPTI